MIPGLISWADRRPNPHLQTWAKKKDLRGDGMRALVVGCGYGDDAAWLADRGFEVLAFDISQTAISAAKKRFLSTTVKHVVADILNPPFEWSGAFDFVYEAYTLQVLKGEFREKAARNIALMVKNELLVIARARGEERETEGEMPWPLTKSQLDIFLEPEFHLGQISFEDFIDDESPPVRRFRSEYRKISVDDPKKTNSV